MYYLSKPDHLGIAAQIRIKYKTFLFNLSFVYYLIEISPVFRLAHITRKRKP